MQNCSKLVCVMSNSLRRRAYSDGAEDSERLSGSEDSSLYVRFELCSSLEYFSSLSRMLFFVRMLS